MTRAARSRLLARVVPDHGWRALGRGAGGGPAVWRPRQVHGARVVEVLSVGDDVRDADGAVSARAGVGVGVVAADCVPLLLAAADGGAVAAVHAGWRGLAAGVVEAAVAALASRHGGPLVAAMGPAASGCCYEVGPEVLESLGLPAGSGRRRIDLRSLVAERLVRAGVARERLERVGPCTICSDAWPSYRRQGAAAGRLLAHAVP